MHGRLERELAELNRLRAATITHLRLAFETHGFDVAACGDDEIGEAILAEAVVGTQSSMDLFARAFARMQARAGGVTER